MFANLNRKNFGIRSLFYITVKTLDPDDLSVIYSCSFQICVFFMSNSDDICDRFTFWKPNTYNKQEYQAKYFNNHVDILKW